MRQRVGIAAALARDPHVLIADEPSTALDVTTQKEILALLRVAPEVARGMGLILITHDLRVAFSMCDRIYVLYAGSVLEVAPAQALEHEPLPPLHARPPAVGAARRSPALPRLVAIPGSVADPDEVAGCCAFSPRCAWAAAGVSRCQRRRCARSATAGSPPASASTSCGTQMRRDARAGQPQRARRAAVEGPGGARLGRRT